MRSFLVFGRAAPRGTNGEVDNSQWQEIDILVVESVNTPNEACKKAKGFWLAHGYPEETHVVVCNPERAYQVKVI